MRTALLLTTLLCCVTATDSVAQQQPAQADAQQTVSRLQYQWMALLVASATNANSHGQSVVEYGSSIGRMFAATWGQNVTPQRLATGMLSNIRMLGLDAELLEDTPERAVLRFAIPDSVRFESLHGAFGGTLHVFNEALRAITEGIASGHDLVWDQRREGTWMIARVARRQ